MFMQQREQLPHNFTKEDILFELIKPKKEMCLFHTPAYYFLPVYVCALSWVS